MPLAAQPPVLAGFLLPGRALHPGALRPKQQKQQGFPTSTPTLLAPPHPLPPTPHPTHTLPLAGGSPAHTGGSRGGSASAAAGAGNAGSSKYARIYMGVSDEQGERQVQAPPGRGGGGGAWPGPAWACCQGQPGTKLWPRLPVWKPSTASSGLMGPSQACCGFP